MNLRMINTYAYRGQQVPQTQSQIANLNFRYEILPGDFSRLYRQHYRLTHGIDLSFKPEYNVDNWLNPESKYFKPAISQAVFKYSARAEGHDRLKLFISTPEMRQAAWKYCHRKQLMIDGTFGLSTSRLLLWIALGIDEAGHGVPVAMFLFSAPTGNRATHAGYDTKIITDILISWRDWLSEQGDDIFAPVSCITDTDLKEREMTWHSGEEFLNGGSKSYKNCKNKSYSSESVSAVN
ncbi:hypothetical protein PHLCEN_2v10231 [Hermanssonia centrifuga]|uniref:Uncharacterized protein n=1 Tax=Hermanssonia centrifuga TaxID=98765 RepID=A0A2R6NNH0_9APHY|nr:hypothetical protein PHLCEN_2v10231 [Hermanssonia centrifuga]